jgi:hypothetical protein
MISMGRVSQLSSRKGIAIAHVRFMSLFDELLDDGTIRQWATLSPPLSNHSEFTRSNRYA